MLHCIQISLIILDFIMWYMIMLFREIRCRSIVHENLFIYDLIDGFLFTTCRKNRSHGFALLHHNTLLPQQRYFALAIAHCSVNRPV